MTCSLLPMPESPDSPSKLCKRAGVAPHKQAALPLVSHVLGVIMTVTMTPYSRLIMLPGQVNST